MFWLADFMGIVYFLQGQLKKHLSLYRAETAMKQKSFKQSVPSTQPDAISATHFLHQLVNSENKYRLLADSVTDVIWVLDIRSLGIIYVSPSVIQLTGYRPEEAVSMELSQFLSPESMETIHLTLKDYLARKNETNLPLTRLELLLRHKNGSLVWAEVTPRFLRDNNREPVGILGVARDCTERLNAEVALRQSEERYRTIMENIEEGFCEVNRNGDILFANNAACAISGYSRDEILRLNFMKVIDPDDAARLSGFISDMLKHGEPIKNFECELIRKDRSRVPLETSIMLVTDKNNNPAGFRAVGRDITKRKKEEWNLKQAYQKLDQRVAERTIELAETNRVLQEKTQRLEEANIALQVLLNRKDENKKRLEKQMMTNIIELILPTLEKIQKIGLNDRQQEYAEMIRSNLNEITSPFLLTLSQAFSQFTPMEIQIANYIKHGKTTKEIAELTNLALSTIDFHRRNIRQKLMIQNTRTNLRAHLLSLE